MSPKLTSSPSGAAEHSVNSIAMPRLVGSSADGSADKVDELQRALVLCETHCLELEDEVVDLKEELTRVSLVAAQLEDRIGVLEQQNEAAPRRQQERRVEGEVVDGYRVCKYAETCKRQFRLHHDYPHEQCCCSECRKSEGMRHSDRCRQRSRPFCGEN